MDKEALKNKFNELNNCIQKACKELEKEKTSKRILGDILMEDFENIKNEIDTLIGLSEFHYFKRDFPVHTIGH